MPKLKKHSVVQKSYQCDFCKVRCRRPQDLRRHLLVHTEASFQCDSCGNKFTRYDTLMRHKRDNCRNSHSPWTDRKHSPSRSMAAHTERTRRDSASPRSPKYHLMSPVTSSEREHIAQGSVSPAPLAPQGYSPQPCSASTQPVLSSSLPPPQLPQPLNGYSIPPWPSEQTYMPQTPPQLAVPIGSPLASVVTMPSEPASIGPRVTTPAYASIQGIASPTYIPAYVHSDPSQSPNVPVLVEASGAGAVRGNQYGSEDQLEKSSPDFAKELPRLSRYPFGDGFVKREHTLQPLEPNPLQFKGSSPIRQMPSYPLKRNSIP